MVPYLGGIQSMKRFHLSLVAALIGASLLGVPSRARAEFQLQFFLGATNEGTIKDNNSPDDNSAVGTIHLTSIAIKDIHNTTQYTITLTAQTTNGSGGGLGTFAVPKMDLNFTVTQNVASADPLKIMASFTGYTAIPASLGMSFANAAPASMTYQTAWSNMGMFMLTNPSSSISPGGSTTLSVPSSASTQYSLEQVVTISSASLGSTDSGEATLGFTVSSQGTSATPAPAGLVLALSGMPVLGLGQWLRRRRAPTAA
jgi:hypothetical protein